LQRVGGADHRNLGIHAGGVVDFVAVSAVLRLSVRREAGEYLFHRLLHADLSSGVAETMIRSKA